MYYSVTILAAALCNELMFVQSTTEDNNIIYSAEDIYQELFNHTRDYFDTPQKLSKLAHLLACEITTIIDEGNFGQYQHNGHLLLERLSHCQYREGDVD